MSTIFIILGWYLVGVILTGCYMCWLGRDESWDSVEYSYFFRLIAIWPFLLVVLIYRKIKGTL